MKENNTQATILSIASYLPRKVLTNHELEKMVDTSDEWIRQRTGIKERRIAEANEAASDLGLEAAKRALKAAHLEPQQIELILCATMTGDYISPSTAAIIQKGLKINAAAFDIGAACSGFVFGLSIAKAYIESGLYQNILFVATEKMSSLLDWKDRATCVLFGDGAAACVITKGGKGLQIERVLIGTDGSQSDLIIVPAGGSREPAEEKSVKERRHYISLQGPEVFKHAVRRMGHTLAECLELSSLKPCEISYFIPHQANARIIETLAKSLRIPQEKIWLVLDRYGNTSASSIGLALEDLLLQKTLNSGERIALTGFGAGLTFGSALLKVKQSIEIID
jgi:3-oxoacyl-[acyl-carrier-protein] synthase-3